MSLQTFASNLKKVMEEKGLTCEGLGTAIGVARATVGAWRMAKGYPGSLDLLIELCDYLEVSIDDFVRREMVRGSVKNKAA